MEPHSNMTMVVLLFQTKEYQQQHLKSLKAQTQMFKMANWHLKKKMFWYFLKGMEPHSNITMDVLLPQTKEIVCGLVTQTNPHRLDWSQPSPFLRFI